MANVSQRSCWRSMPRARRKRPTGDPAAPTKGENDDGEGGLVGDDESTVEGAGGQAGCRPPRAGRSPGLGDRVTTASNTTGVAAVIPAHQRQPGDGNRPVGVTSSGEAVAGHRRHDGGGHVAGRSGRRLGRRGHAVVGGGQGDARPRSATDPGPAGASPPGARGGGWPPAAPTVAVLTAPSTGAKAVGFKTTSSGRPVWRSSWSSQTSTTRPRIARSKAPTPARSDAQRVRGPRVTAVTAMVLAER